MAEGTTLEIERLTALHAWAVSHRVPHVRLSDGTELVLELPPPVRPKPEPAPEMTDVDRVNLARARLREHLETMYPAIVISEHEIDARLRRDGVIT